MDAEHRVDGQEGTPNGAPEAGAPSSSEAGVSTSQPAEGGAGSEASAAPGGPPAEPRVEAATGESQAALAEGAASTGEASGAGAPEQVAAGASQDEVDSEDEEPMAPPEERLSGRVTTVLLPLERLTDDTAFRLRDEGDVSGLATDVARLGQLFPVDVRPSGEDRYELVCGFRRVAALRFLKRDAVQARVHASLSDEDALLMSLAEAIHATPVEPEVLEAKRAQLQSEGRLSAPVRDMLDKALATEDGLAPEGVEEEIDGDELAADVSQRLGEINQELSMLADVFASLDESRRAELLMQLRYSSDLVKYLEGL